MTEKLVNNSNDANCRTKESVDRIAVTLCKIETRINQLAGKMELQDETMRQTCATKGDIIDHTYFCFCFVMFPP